MTYEQIHNLFKQRYNQTNWKQFLGEAFAKSRLFATAEILTGIDSNVASQVQKLGYITLNENGIERQIAVYEVTLAQGIILERNRVGLRNLLRKYWIDIDAAFIAYHRPETPKWRFTYVSELTGYDADGEFVKIKTEPKRYTYVLGEGESTRTAAERFTAIASKGSKATLDDVKEAFSVEKLSKAFFDEYKKHYDIFCDFMVSKPNIRQTIFNGDEKGIRDFNKKLLGRIVFLYFIQKKGWLGVPAKSDWGKGDFDFLVNLFKNTKNPDLFYSELLSKLFFDTLNTKRKDDLIELVKGEPCRIPYLNGGLFEEDNKKHRNLIFPANLFKSLFDFFNQYNFTIYEDDPNDHTVAVDPEMLGHIFENLLEDNKDKGAYYTPKEIVHYMCQESLIEYLTTWFENKGYEVVGYIGFDKPEQPKMFSVNEGRKGQLIMENDNKSTGKQIDRMLIEKLLKKKLDDADKNLIKKHSAAFHNALDNVKICDPAIGSGAFPMGLLHEIFTAKQTLHIFEHGNTKTFDASEVKLNIIQNSIYGVDIEKGAVDIARLRFWLSLIVDEEKPKALPNLDYKIVVGNSLISKLGDDNIDIDWTLKQGVGFQANIFGTGDLRANKAKLLKKISQEQREFFNSESDKKKLSADIRKLKIDLLINQLELMIITKGLENKPTGTGKQLSQQTEVHLQTLSWKKSIKQLNKLKDKPELLLNFFDWKLDFPEVMNEQVATNIGFDIIIGNPPYIQLQKIPEVSKILERRNFETFSKTGDIYCLFYEIGSTLLKKYGVLTYITNASWMRTLYGKSLRSFFLNKVNPIKLIDLSDSEIFESATVLTNILVYKNDIYKNRLEAVRLIKKDYKKNESLDNFFNSNKIVLNSLSDSSWTVQDGVRQLIKNKVSKFGVPLKNWQIEINIGILNGLNEAFVIDEQTKSKIIKEDKKASKIIYPMLRGRDMKKYYPSFSGLYLINTYNGEFKEIIENGRRVKRRVNQVKVYEDYPSVYEHLLKFKAKAKIRHNQGDHWTNLRNCAYNNDFLKPKIIYPSITKDLTFLYDENNFFSNDKSFILVGQDLKYLISFLNSSLFRYCFADSFPELQGNVRELKKNIMVEIPVLKIDNVKQKPFIKLVDKILNYKSEGKATKALEQEIDNLVYKLYELTYEEVKVIDPEFSLSKKEYEALNLSKE